MGWGGPVSFLKRYAPSPADGRKSKCGPRKDTSRLALHPSAARIDANFGVELNGSSNTRIPGRWAYTQQHHRAVTEHIFAQNKRTPRAFRCQEKTRTKPMRQAVCTRSGILSAPPHWVQFYVTVLVQDCPEAIGSARTEGKGLPLVRLHLAPVRFEILDKVR